MRKLFSILVLSVFLCQNISLADSGTFCLAYKSPLDKTSKKDLRDGVSRLAHKGSGVIGKVSERAGAKYAEVVDPQGAKKDVRLSEIELGLGLLKSSLPDEAASNEIIIGLFRRGISLKSDGLRFYDFPKVEGVELYTYGGNILVWDTFGFSSPGTKTIVVDRELSGNPVAVFHLLCEYLYESRQLSLELTGDNLVIRLDKLGNVDLQEFTIDVGSVKTELVQEGDEWVNDPERLKQPHYLLRLLSRRLLGEADKKLTRELKYRQTRELAYKQNIQEFSDGGFSELLRFVSEKAPSRGAAVDMMLVLKEMKNAEIIHANMTSEQIEKELKSITSYFSRVFEAAGGSGDARDEDILFMQYLGILKTVGAENRMIASVYIICSLYSGKNMSEIHGAVSGFSGDLKQWFLGALKEMADSYRDANKDKNGAEVIKTDLDLAVMNMYALVYLLTSGNEVFSRVDGIFEWIVTGAKIEKGWNDANSGFRYGDGLISATSVSVLFAIAFHEIMHDVLFQKGYNCEYFRRQVIHEFLSDVCAFYGFCLMGLGDKILEYKEVFRYVKSLALAESSGGVMTQQHRAARAQLELVVEWFDSLNKELRRQSKAEKPLQDQFGYLLSIGVKNVLNEPDIRISNLTRRMVTGIFTDLDGQIFADIIDRPSSGRGGGKAVTLAMRAPTQVRRFVCGTRASGASL